MSNSAANAANALFNPEFQLGYSQSDVKGVINYHRIKRVVDLCRAGHVPSLNPKLIDAICQNAKTCLDASRYRLDAELYDDNTRSSFDEDFKSRCRLFEATSDILSNIEPSLKDIPLKDLMIVLASLHED